jgi:hypothetical protein
VEADAEPLTLGRKTGELDASNGAGPLYPPA